MLDHKQSCRSEKCSIYYLTVVIFLLFAPALLQAKEVTHQFHGLTLNANLELAEGRVLTDGVVLILHGIMGHNRMEIIETTQQALLDNDRSSLAINLSLSMNNRHGFFDCTWPHHHVQDDAIDEISVWVGWLRDQGVTRVILMAHSRGANQAMVYAVDNKDPEVTQLIFLAPGTFDDSNQQFANRYGNHFGKLMAKAQKNISTGMGNQIMEKTDFWFCPQAKVTADSFVSYYSDKSRFRNFQSYLPRITVPTLITTGTQDERQPDIKKHVYPYVDGKLVRLSVIEGADHFFRDFNIEEAMEAAVEFLQNTE
ncbi:MAG: alpha/beta hydrolase [Thiotrichaceae bacterium]|nr:alpha/beta hydrolase [Thiotrichaceae bacterium]